MKLRILCVGRLKEKYFSDACREYAKRLTRYADVETVEVADEKAPEELSEALRDKVRSAEGTRLLSHIADTEYVVALAIDGKSMDSAAFASTLDTLMQSGKSDIVFVIGGSLGLSKSVLARADMRWSFSQLTFPHQLFRVMLLEQLYRAFRILRNEPYHK